MNIGNIKKKLGKAVRKIVAPVLIAGMFMQGVGRANDDAQKSAELPIDVPKRILTLDFANPLTSFEANSDTTYSANQVVAKGLDYIGEKGLNNNIFGRIGIGLAHAYKDLWTRELSHEAAHDHKLDFSGDFRSDLTPQFNENKKLESMTEEEKLEDSIRGLNQNTYNAENMWLYAHLRKSSSFDNKLSFLMNSLYLTFYNGNPETRKTEEPQDDLEEYIKGLKEKGIKETRGRVFAKSLAANALTFFTYESIYGIGDYVVNGRKVRAPYKFKIGETEITPPLVSHYLTPKGSFYSLTSIINPEGENPLSISLGTDLDFLGDGKVDCLRAGGKYSIPLWRARLAPFAYVNANHSGGFKGFSAGVEGSLPLTPNASLRAKVDVSKRDVLENTVKEKGNLNFLAGIDIAF